MLEQRIPIRWRLHRAARAAIRFPDRHGWMTLAVIVAAGLASFALGAMR